MSQLSGAILAAPVPATQSTYQSEVIKMIVLPRRNFAYFVIRWYLTSLYEPFQGDLQIMSARALRIPAAIFLSKRAKLVPLDDATDNAKRV